MKSNMLTKNWGGREKANQRHQAVVESCCRGVKTALFLPGNELNCVRLALECGVINKQSFLVLLEREPLVRAVIRKEMKKLGFKIISPGEWNGTVQQGVGVLYEDSSRYTSNVQLQYGFFDFCGNPMPDVMKFIDQCNFASKAELIFTFAQSWRHNALPTKIRKMKGFSSIVKKVKSMLHLPGVGFHGDMKNPKKTEDKAVMNIALLYGATSRFSKKLVYCNGYHDSRCFMQAIKIQIKGPHASGFWQNVFSEAVGGNRSKTGLNPWIEGFLKVQKLFNETPRLSDVRKFVNRISGLCRKEKDKIAQTLNDLTGVAIHNNIPVKISSADRIFLRNLGKKNLEESGERTLKLADAA